MYNFEDSTDYLSRIVIITKYIYLTCQETIRQNIRDFILKNTAM